MLSNACSLPYIGVIEHLAKFVFSLEASSKMVRICLTALASWMVGRMNSVFG
jgi:hypothetical protein